MHQRRAGRAVEIASEVSDESPLTPEYAPIYLVQHGPLERITTTMWRAKGDAQDAMLSEKITERIHAEEYRTSVLDVEPTPEVLVGSLHVTSDIDFERISDDEPAEAARPNIPLAPETLDWDPPLSSPIHRARKRRLRSVRLRNTFRGGRASR